MKKIKSHYDLLVENEIQELDLKIALCRYELEEAICTGVPMVFCKNINAELSNLLFKRLAFRLGKFVVYGEHIRYTLKY